MTRSPSKKRLDEAERAVKLGMQVVDDLARIDRERSHRPYLERDRTEPRRLGSGVAKAAAFEV